MKKTAVFLSLLFLTSCAHAENSGSGFAGRDEARYIRLNTSSFDNNLSPDDVDVQTAMETLDELVAGGGGGGMSTNDIDTSAELRTILTDENGTGALLFSGATSPTFVTPVLGVAAATSMNVGGLVMTGDSDGALTILGAGDGFDEDIIFNLDDTENTWNIYSSTGVDTILLTGLDLTVPDDAYNATTWNANNDVPTKNAVRDKIEALTASDTLQRITTTLSNITLTDNLCIGSASCTAKIGAVGDADEPQIVAIGNATQTEPLYQGLNSALTEVFSVEADGTVRSVATGTEAWTFGGGSQSTYVTTYNLSGTDFTMTASSGTATYSGALASTTFDTGQGANELYDMDQNVLTTSSPTFVDTTVTTEVYDATGWNGDNTVPTKDAVRDKIETLSGGGGSQILCANSATSNTATFYMGMGGASSTTETVARTASTPLSVTVSNFYAGVQTAAGGADSWTVTVREEGSNTTVTCSMNASATTCNDTTHSFTLDAGNDLSIQWANDGSSTGTGGQGFCMELTQ